MCVENEFNLGGFMETLVEIAKRLGIKPNPMITETEYLRIKSLMSYELTGKEDQDIELDTKMYDFHKQTPNGTAQKFNKELLNQNIKHFKEHFLTGIKSAKQSDGDFWYHSAGDSEAKERFVADIKLDDPSMPEIFKELDEFILRYKGAYKIVLDGNRTDTLNLYMSESITAKTAREFYEIVRPVLQTKNHTCLDGFPITQNGQEIEGVKFGPEPMSEVSRTGDFLPMKERLKSVLPDFMIKEISRQYCGKKSLGEIASKVQLANLLYYLVGKEGQNPIQLGNQLGDPKKKYTKKSIEITPQNAKIYGVFHKLFGKGNF